MKAFRGGKIPLDIMVKRCTIAREEFGPDSKQYVQAYEALLARAKREAEVCMKRLDTIKLVA